MFKKRDSKSPKSINKKNKGKFCLDDKQSVLLQAPMSDCWDNITTGMKVEVENFDCDNFSEDFPNSFWVATVLKVSGKLFSK